MRISGSNFGAPSFDLDAPIAAAYGSLSASCTRVSNTALRCVTAPGAGVGHRWVVTSAAVTSSQSPFVTR